MPNFYLFRPADATENVECWKVALKLQAPSGFVLSRQKLKTLKPHKEYGEVSNGGYLLTKREGATVTLLASGSEVMLALQSACFLESDFGIKCNIVSVPCFDLLCEQDQKYIDKIIDPNTTKIAIEASRSMEWYKFADHFIGMDSFGASGKANDLFNEFGFTIDSIKHKVKEIVG
jgi:transketolase